MNLKPDTAPEAVGTILEELRKLPSEISAIREYQVGPGLNPGNATLAIVGLFDDAEAFEKYRSHPAHRAVAQDHLVPAMESAQSIQFEV
jgi:hypothetical protein